MSPEEEAFLGEVDQDVTDDLTEVHPTDHLFKPEPRREAAEQGGNHSPGSMTARPAYGHGHMPALCVPTQAEGVLESPPPSPHRYLQQSQETLLGGLPPSDTPRRPAQTDSCLFQTLSHPSFYSTHRVPSSVTTTVTDGPEKTGVSVRSQYKTRSKVFKTDSD